MQKRTGKIKVLMLDLKSNLHSQPYQMGLVVAYALADPEVAKNVEFVFSNHYAEQPAEEIAEIVSTASPEMLAMSSYVWNHVKIRNVLAILGRSGRELPRIVVGGANCAGKCGVEMMAESPIISAIVDGEGEPAFRDIALSLADSPTKDPFANARNCRSREQVNTAAVSNMGHRVIHLDEIPSPYLTGLLPLEPSPVFYETNRGCPYRCSFCYWGNGNSQIHRMSFERVQEELTFFAKRRVSSLFLADANFGIFDSDLKTAEIMAELNSRHNYPFKFLGVNYAKNSNDRVLELATILRAAKINTATTLALQTVSPEAEKLSKRYAVESLKFVGLVREAYQKDVTTYTDLILGLPGESLSDFLKGIEAAIYTGVPAIKIHQLSLLPGTEFYDKQEEFGLTKASDSDSHLVPLNQRPANWEFMVVSHPKLDAREMQRGLRYIGINHLMHNHNLGSIVNFYLARHGVLSGQVYEFFDDLITGQINDASLDQDGFFGRVRDLIILFSRTGLDSMSQEAVLANQTWFGGKGFRAEANDKEVRSFMHSFYRAFCSHYGICSSPADVELLKEFIDYNMLISPKPRWKPMPEYRFNYDIRSIWQDMLFEILNPGENEKRSSEGWHVLSKDVLSRLSKLLSDSYLESRKRPVTYKVENPLPFFPEKMTSAWAVTNRDWFCRVTKVSDGDTDRQAHVMSDGPPELMSAQPI